jgi:hypothetical protein
VRQRSKRHPAAAPGAGAEALRRLAAAGDAARRAELARRGPRGRNRARPAPRDADASPRAGATPACGADGAGLSRRWRTRMTAAPLPEDIDDLRCCRTRRASGRGRQRPLFRAVRPRRVCPLGVRVGRSAGDAGGDPDAARRRLLTAVAGDGRPCVRGAEHRRHGRRHGAACRARRLLEQARSNCCTCRSAWTSRGWPSRGISSSSATAPRRR